MRIDPSLHDLAHLRLHNQLLAQPHFTQPAEVVRWLGAVQAQEYAGAQWSVAQRLVNATAATLEQAFTDGAIIRTHVLRPTWHFVHPADLRWLLRLTAPRVHALNAYYYRQEGLDDHTQARSHAVLMQALQGGKQLTRSELRTSLDEAGIAVASDLRLVYLLMHAELEGVICSGGRRGKQFTYALLDERVPPTPTLTREEALAALVKRYFCSHGPATVQDFVWWSGLTVADAKAGIELAGAALTKMDVNDKTYWVDAALTAQAPAPFTAHLLPTYDEYLLSYADRSAALDPQFAHIWNGSDASFTASVVIAGQVVGLWRRTLRKRTVTIETKFFRQLTANEEAAFAAAVTRYGDFLDVTAVVQPLVEE